MAPEAIKQKPRKQKAVLSDTPQPPAAPELAVSETKEKKKRSKTEKTLTTEEAAPAHTHTHAAGHEGVSVTKKGKKAKAQAAEADIASTEVPAASTENKKKRKRSKAGEAQDAKGATDLPPPVVPELVEVATAKPEPKKRKRKAHDPPAAEEAPTTIPDAAPATTPKQQSQPTPADAPLDATQVEAPKKKRKEKWSAERKAEAKKERVVKTHEAEAIASSVEKPGLDVAASVADTVSAAASEQKKKHRKSKQIASGETSVIVPDARIDPSPVPAKSLGKTTKSTAAQSSHPRSPSPVPVAENVSHVRAGADDDSGAPQGGKAHDGMSDDGDDFHLHGFSSGEDSSDDDLDGDEFHGFDISSLPTVARDDATVKRKLDRAKRLPAADRGVIYLGRIPHGFYEDQMRAYFSQFGDVTRLRLSRNKRTGRSKHYGFIEFDSAAVAQIVAETMDNYLLMGHILNCKVIPKDEVHPSLWVGADRKWHNVPLDRLTRVKHNKPRTEEAQREAENRLLKRQQAKKRKLADASIDYNFDAVAYKRPKAKTRAISSAA